MKKTLIALALTALPVAAMADVVLYGQIKGGVGYVSNNNDYQNGSITQLEDYGSRIGFKGSEDLGNGLKAIWQVEQKVSLAGKDAAGSWNTRDTFIGLEGGFGKVRAGYISDQFNENMGDVDQWEYGHEVRGLNVFTRTANRLQGVRYDTPTFGGFNANITHQLADSATETAFEPANSTQGQATVVGLNYENSGFFAKYGYGLYKHTYVNTNGDLKDGQVHRLEGGYNANNLFVAAGYQNTKGYDVAGTTLAGIGLNNPYKSQEATVSAAYTMGAITPKITYAHGWGFKGLNGTPSEISYDQVVLGADYALSKRTTALVSAGWMDSEVTHERVTGRTEKGYDNAYSVGVGVRHKF